MTTPFPSITLPSNTVVGRLGAGTSGPAQAIPVSSILALDNTFFVNVLAFGAVGDDLTDNSTAFANAYNALASRTPTPGGILYIPAGIYRIATFPTITQDGVRIVGESQGEVGTSGTILRQTATSGDFIVFSGSAHSSVEHINFKPVNILTNGYQITVRNGFRHTIDHVRMDFHYNGVLMDNTNGLAIIYEDQRSQIGTRGINAINGSQGLTFHTLVHDTGYPVSVGTRKTWTTNTGFTAGDIVVTNSTVWNCLTSGTSSNSGTGPTGFPAGATTPDQIFSGFVQDGTAQWKFCFASDLAHITLDEGVGSTVCLGNVGLLNGNVGLQTVGSSSGPIFITCFDLECDHQFTAGLYLNLGISMLFVNLFAGSCLNGPGVTMNSGLSGEVAIVNGTIGGNNTHGIEINNLSGNQAGKILIDNCIITNNSQLSFHTYNGVNIESNARRVSVTNNLIGNVQNNDTPGDSQAYGVAIGSGANWIYVAGNNVFGNTTGGILNSSTAVHNIVTNNIGYNPVGISAASNVGASPATITAGASPETHYLNQSATNSATVAKGTRQIATLKDSSTYYVVELGPNESYVVTWLTTQPTFTRDIH